MAAIPYLLSLVAVYTIVALWLLNLIRKRVAYYYAMRTTGAKEPPIYPHKDPILGIDLFLEDQKTFNGDYFLNTNVCHFKIFGDTFKANQFGTTIIKTRDPKISKAFHATHFKKFGLQSLRYENSKALFRNSIIIIDGPAWSHAKTLIKPSFETVHIASFKRLNRHVDQFMELLPEDDSTVDLFPLIKLLVRLKFFLCGLLSLLLAIKQSY